MNAGKDERAAGASEKSVGTREKLTGEHAEISEGPVGLDIGTSHIVAAQKKFNYIETIQELNAFFTVSNTKFARDFLHQKDVMYYEHGNQFYIFGYSAESFANMFNTETRRSIKNGLISSKEEDSINVIKALVYTLIQKPKNFGETLCFVIPGEPLQGTGSVVYHESIIKRILGGLGYSPISINEGMAIVVSELSKDDYTGIGISMGGGMCNVCLSFLSFPVITYSIQMAGDYIDEMVGTSVGEPATKIKVIKEEELDLSEAPKDRVTTALHIFYDELIYRLLDLFQRVLSSAENVPRIKAPIPIVLTGGTAMPKGCKEKFEDMLKKFSLPVEISEVRLAEDPLNTTAKGALIMAMTEAE
ncbi:MAG: hypothetical protein JRI95_12630 [Deltaproteobacteria bacterium]|nr:hypothetical protein [Deltaproteobacteria bacterium]